MLDDEAPVCVDDSGAAPARARRRKRGQELRRAVHTAVIDELRERGYAAMTMDAVAARAQTGKATLYRYWSNKIDLVLDAALSSMAPIHVPADDGDLRRQLLDVLRQVAADLAAPTNIAIRSLIAELVRTPELTEQIRPHMDDPTLAPILEVLRRAAVREQIPVAALTPRVAGVGPDLLRSHTILNGIPIPDPVVVEILDFVVLPLLRGYTVPPANGHAPKPVRVG